MTIANGSICLMSASGVSPHTHQLANRLMSNMVLYFTTPATIPILDSCLSGFDLHKWRQFTKGPFACSDILLDILNDGVRINAVALMPHFSYEIPLDMLSVLDYEEIFANNVLAHIHTLLFLLEHDRLLPGGRIALLNPPFTYDISRATTFSSVNSLRAAIHDIQKLSDLFSTISYKFYLPPKESKPEIEDIYIEDVVKFLYCGESGCYGRSFTLGGKEHSHDSGGKQIGLV